MTKTKILSLVCIGTLSCGSAFAEPATFGVHASSGLLIEGVWFDPSRCADPTDSLVTIAIGEQRYRLPPDSLRSFFPAEKFALALLDGDGFKLTFPLSRGCLEDPMTATFAEIRSPVSDPFYEIGIRARQPIEGQSIRATKLGQLSRSPDDTCNDAGEGLIVCTGVENGDTPVAYFLITEPSLVQHSGGPYFLHCKLNSTKPICDVSDDIDKGTTYNAVLPTDFETPVTAAGIRQRYADAEAILARLLVPQK